MTMKQRARQRAGPGRPPVLDLPRRIEVTLELDQLEAMNIAASDAGISRNELIRALVSAWLEGRMIEMPREAG